MNLKLTTLWGNAAWREAARVRAAEIDLDHLYLGLIALGGSAARVLGRHSITLTSARERAHEALASDLAHLGLADAASTLPPPLALEDLGEGGWEATPRARGLLDRVQGPDTFALLVALLQEPTGTVRRLVAADGVAPQELVPELKAGSDDAYSAERVPVQPGLLPEPARGFRVRTFISAPPAAVADAVADPTLLPLWALDPHHERVGDDPRTLRLTRGSRTMTLRFDCRQERCGDATVVTWVPEMLDGRYAGQPLSYDRFEARPAPGGTELIRTAGRRRFGPIGAVLGPVWERFQGWGMVHSTQVMAFAVADRAAS